MSLAQALTPADDGNGGRRLASEESFQRFVEEQYPRLEKFLARQCFDPHLAEDALHEALIVAMEKWDIISEHKKPLYWVRRIAWHKLLTLQDRQRWNDQVPLENLPNDVAEPTGSREAEALLRLVLAQLPYRQRAVLALLVEGDSDEDDARLTASTARLLRDLVDCDPCGMLGRYEFGVLMPYTTLETAAPVAERIVATIRNTRFLAGRARLEAFGGLVRYDYRIPTDSIDLLLDAETAWRRARHEDQHLHVLRQAPSAEHRREICRAGIRNAVEQNRFTLYAQPLRDLELNQITRHEILLRVFDEVGRPTPPTSFLELAEHVDEILAVDKWVIHHALRLIGESSQTSHYQINISGRSLADPLLLEHIRNAVGRFGVDPRNLTIEITETAAIDNLIVARRFADGVRELGCQVALDDFGGGHTPLGFLTKLPVDLIKIDGAFIQGLPESEPLQAVVRALVQMCRQLGILTAAEYVQDEATLDLLRGYGLNFAQGFHVGEPEELVLWPRRTKSVELEISPVLATKRREVG